MNHEQLAVVNQQLAGMLRSGIPLEGALERLCLDMQAGALREELAAMGTELKSGRPLAEAVAARKLPPFYVRMVQLGARGQDLPGVLAMLGDYYQRSHLIWTRLSGLMLYPVLVLLTATVLSVLVALVLQLGFGALGADGSLFGATSGSTAEMQRRLWRPWAPAVLFLLLFLVALAFATLKPLKRWVRWGVPGFREASLANLASCFHLMLSKGCPLGDAVSLAGGLESGSPAGRDLERWSRRLAEGRGKFPEIAAGGECFPGLFVWLVGQGGEDVATGFRRAAELYHQRAVHKVEMLLYLALPVSVMLLGSLMVVQFLPLVRLLVMQMDMLGSVE